jgi:hypothetical protein
VFKFPGERGADTPVRPPLTLVLILILGLEFDVESGVRLLSLAPKIKDNFKSVGQECPTHTSDHSKVAPPSKVFTV